MGEFYYRRAEKKTSLTPGCEWIADSTLGFADPPNKTCRHITLEFDTTYTLNSDGHRSSEFDADPSLCTVMALGDSHTRAVGVSDGQAWPSVMEALIKPQLKSRFQVVNMAGAGYSVGQEYSQMRKYLRKYRPAHVVLGFSLATDAYDIRTPANGGFVYGSDFTRPYFDVENATLVFRNAPQSTDKAAASVVPTNARGVGQRIRSILDDNSALFRATYRGVVGQYGVRLLRQVGVNSWPNADSVLDRHLSPVDEHSWLIVEKLLEQFHEQLSTQQIGFTVVIIPYLPQVYDSVWSRTFASESERYDRFAGNRRLKTICEQYHLDCQDLTESFIEAARTRGRWLHYKQDGHPTPEGQTLIGELITDHLRAQLGTECRSAVAH